jgi:hypothetical protein
MEQDLLKILVDIFKSSGYNVTIFSQCDLIVENYRHHAYVRCASRSDYEEIRAFYEKLRGCKGIYVMTQKASGELSNYAAEFGIHLWDRDDLAFQIGRMVLINIERKIKNSYFGPEASLTNKTLDSSTGITFESHSEGWKEYIFGQESNSSKKILPLQSQSLGADNIFFEVKSLLRPSKEMNNPNKLAHVEIPKVDSYRMLNILSVEPNFSKNQAMDIAKSYFSNPEDAILKFVPFWKYIYNVEVEKRFRSKVLSISGKGFLNALNKSNEDMKIEGLRMPTRIPAVQHEIRRPNVNRKQAEKIIVNLIIEENTREMRFNNMDGQAIIYEHRNIGPRAEDIELNMELVHIPIWEVRGKRNSLEINAYNAKVLEQPMDEDAEFL